MPNSTANLGLNIFLEDEVFDVDQVNENFQKLDVVPMCTETGTMTSYYSGASVGTITWYYKRYQDKTIELNASVSLNLLITKNGTSQPYYSDTVEVGLPVQFSSIYDAHISVASNTQCWPSIIASSRIIDSLNFVLLSKNKVTSTTNNFKTIFIQVKGVEDR